MKKIKNLHQVTRKIYHNQHNRILKDEVARTRIHNMYTEEYFKVLGTGWFKNKKILDAGCGNMAVLMARIGKFGCTDMTGVDISNEWIPYANSEILREGIPSKNFKLLPGNVMDLPFSNETFDFVACNGVLVHLADLGEVNKAFTECSRVLKKGGYFYTSYGTVGGIIEGVIFPALRIYSQNNKEFRELIDNISPKLFVDLFKKIQKDIEKYTGEKTFIKHMSEYFDEDFCVYLQNALQAPSRLHQQCSVTSHII